MHPTASPAGVHHATQFMSSVLSQRGPDALPYTEDTKYLIRHHLVSLAEAFPSLAPKASHFVHNDGHSCRLLQADGTIPIFYAGVVYNIPATIWLLESYPRSPPSVFLSPTRDMVVKPNHPHVDRSGHVSVPYLRSWVFPSSNLVDLVRSLSQLFGLDPPLYTRQQPPAPSQSYPSRPPTSSSPSPVTSSYSASAAAPSQSYPSRPPTSSTPSPITSSYSASPYGGRLPTPPSPAPASRPTEDATEVFRRNAINKIVDMVHTDTVNLRRLTEAEMEGMFSTQAELRRREEALTLGLGEMLEEKEGLEQQLQTMLMNADVLEGWLRENEGKNVRWRDGRFDIDDVFHPADALSKQILECASADMAVDDTVYSLDKALHEGMISFEVYAKSVRALSREQFFHRALAAKVKAAHVQMRVSNMAARVS